jgi:hypothetical protein
VLLSDYAGLELKDKVPLFQIVPARKRILQDFLAPFYQYQQAYYRLQYPENTKSRKEDQLQLKGQVSIHYFNKSRPFIAFSLDFEENELTGFSIEKSGRHIKALSTE